MNECRRLCIVTNAFPLEEYPINHFLEQLVYAFADLGITCDVIAPNCPLFLRIKGIPYKPKAHSVRFTKQGNEVNVYCPSFISLMGKKRWGINLLRFYQKGHCRAAMRFLRKHNKEYDAFYAHFILPSALTAVKLGSKYNKPVFFAYGDSSIDDILQTFSPDYLRKHLQTVRGVVAVSSKNRDELIQNNVVSADKIGVFINAIDTSVFYPIDQNDARKELGIDPEDFVVVFVGHFDNRKGSRRLSKALDMLGGVKSIFIGGGKEAPDCDGILFSGRLPHDKLVTYINASDVFVLPTLAEGCCNAIIEAMACGLPIISSDLPFNDDILDDSNSIRINPNHIDEIANAIRLLQNASDTRNALSQGALKTAEKLTIDRRAKNIIAFMKDRCG